MQIQNVFPSDAESADLEGAISPSTTPKMKGLDAGMPPSLCRRNSPPSTLHFDEHFKLGASDVLLEASPKTAISADRASVMENGTGGGDSASSHPQLQRRSGRSSPHADGKAMKSPCFIHSHLDKGASLTDWIRQKHHQPMADTLGLVKSLQHTNDSHHPHHHQLQHRPHHTNGRTTQHVSGTLAECKDDGDDDDDDYGSSLTKQLAETAVGVREMSKQLGRARVRFNIQSVLIITKARDNRLIKLTRELALYLMLKPRHGSSRGLIVYVDNQLRTSRRFDAEGIRHDHPELFVPLLRRRSSSSSSTSSHSSHSSVRSDSSSDAEGQLRYWTSDMCRHSPHLFDFVVTLGGDGTVLFTSWLFQRIVPPVLPFALGSLGFLTNFDFADYQAVMDSAIESGIRVNLRMRFTCTVYRAVAVDEAKRRKAVKKGETGEIIMKNVDKGGWEALEGGWGNLQEGSKGGKDKEIMCFTTRPAETFEVLNDLVVDRGPSPYVSLLELFGDEHHMTTVQADGLTVSTPTGSTAYSLSAGGSLVHPEIPAILITPICPHTLSFRPMLLPDSMELRICVPYNSRSTAWASFDGRGRVELKQGDHIKITASKYPFPTVCADKQSTDWFHSISRTLKWNERERQKSFVVVEEGPAKTKHHPHSKSLSNKGEATELSTMNIVDQIEEDDEDEAFDINDSSPEADPAVGLMGAAGQTCEDEQVEREKALELAAEGRRQGVASRSKSRTRQTARSNSRTRRTSMLESDAQSGVESPGRYAGPHHRPPRILSSRRDVPIDSEASSPSSADSTDPRLSNELARYDTKHVVHSPLPSHPGTRSRVQKEHDIEVDGLSIKTPTVLDLMKKTHSPSERHPRAFAVWGLDDSDSAASDSDK